MAKYEGVQMYTDVTPDHIKAQKKEVLKEMALTGTSGARAIRGQELPYERYDYGVDPSQISGTVEAELDRERSRMMQGLEMARGSQAKDHIAAMDRMAARNIQYAEAMPHAAALSRQNLEKEIAAMKLAAEAAAGGGRGGGGGGRGGRGGRGGGGGSGAYLDGPIQDTKQSTKDSRIEEIYFTSAANLANKGYNDLALQWSGAALQKNKDATLAQDTIFRSGVNKGRSPDEMQQVIYANLRRQGKTAAEAMAIAITVGQNYGATTGLAAANRTAGGGLQAMLDFTPGGAALSKFINLRSSGSTRAGRTIGGTRTTPKSGSSYTRTRTGPI